MNNQLEGTHILNRPQFVTGGMGLGERSVMPPQSAFDAANRAFDLGYHEGRDELGAALEAATPHVRRDEAAGALEILRRALMLVPEGLTSIAVSDAVRALEARVHILTTMAT